MFTVFNSMRPNSMTSSLVELQVRRWEAAQPREQPAAPRQARQPQESAQARLQASPFLPLRDLHCVGDRDKVTIRGRVPTQYLKDLSALLVRSIDGVRSVTNDVEVLPLGWSHRAGFAPGGV